VSLQLLQSFLEHHAEPDLAERYSYNRETQILVAADGGEKIKNGYRNSEGDEWFNIRIASRSAPVQRIDREYLKHIEAIGMSGWDFVEHKSYWVGFDFDSILGHKQGLADVEIEKIVGEAKKVEWVELRYSTSGKGIHIYVPIHNCPSIPTRKEHIGLAKCILSNLSGLLSFDFKSKVDTCGTILWCWHRRGNSENSFKQIKPATTYFDASVIKQSLTEAWREAKSKTKDLVSNLKFINLSEEHKKVLEWFSKQQATWWWDAEYNMLVCHTFDLLKCHAILKLKGLYFTESKGENCPNDQNCFMFPLRGGSWIIRRHSLGCKEHELWKQDKSGWTFCYYNRVPTIDDLASIFGGEISANGQYVFPNADAIEKVLSHLAPSFQLKLPQFARDRQVRIKLLKNSRVALLLEKLEGESIPGWINNRKTWEKVVQIIEEDIELTTPDDLIRHVVSNSQDAGWFVKSKEWVDEPKGNIISVLASIGYQRGLIDEVIGKCILNPWRLVNRPFSPEYLGNREWNKYAAQLMYDPKPGDYSEWMKVLNHLGKNLADSVKLNSWCVANSIENGLNYLMMWMASILQFPQEPLPYLFLYGPQLCGKSTFHEAFSLLVTNKDPQLKAVQNAGNALTNPNKFNGELAGALLCYVEEINLTQSKGAYDKIKEWVTGRMLSIHDKKQRVYDIENTTHWVHCANNSDACPIVMGDTRIVMVAVDKLPFIEPKEKQLQRLKEQASAFTHALLSLEIPPAIDRLRIPVIDTESKREEAEATANLVEQFIMAEIRYVLGHSMKVSVFAERFHQWLAVKGLDNREWTTIKIGRSIPQADGFPIKGKFGSDIILGNCSFDKDARDADEMFEKNGERLIRKRVVY